LERNEKQVVSVNIMFAVGSQDEKEDELGFAHFIEHMMFKGTKDMSAEDIMDKLTFYGADFNAFTSKTTTKYVFKCLTENFEECFKIYADMILNPEFKQEELDRERQVVVEEMKRSDDEPLDILYRRTMENYFDGLSFAHDELGTEEIIENVSREKLLEFKNRFYKPENCVVSVAGDIDFYDLDRIVTENIAGHFDYKAEKHKVSFEPFDINISKKYDIVFMDHMMPEMDGVETLHKIREDEENLNRETRVIVLTANAIPGAREDYLKEGFAEYLTKPVVKEKLEEVVGMYVK
jgi:predicted Zn-dependent peptidase